MRTVRQKVFKFSELSDDAKQKAIDWYRDGEDYCFLGDNIVSDAKEVGLKIISLDDYRANHGEFINSATITAEACINNHGNTCETYKEAEKFLIEKSDLVKKYSDGVDVEQVSEDNEYEFDKEFDELEADFLHDLLECYRIMYNDQVDYQNSDEYVTENLILNEYEFTQDGKIF